MLAYVTQKRKKNGGIGTRGDHTIFRLHIGRECKKKKCHRLFPWGRYYFNLWHLNRNFMWANFVRCSIESYHMVDWWTSIKLQTKWWNECKYILDSEMWRHIAHSRAYFRLKTIFYGPQVMSAAVTTIMTTETGRPPLNIRNSFDFLWIIHIPRASFEHILRTIRQQHSNDFSIQFGHTRMKPNLPAEQLNTFNHIRLRQFMTYNYAPTTHDEKRREKQMRWKRPFPQILMRSFPQYVYSIPL